jgi:hypothetical protein
LTPLLSYCVALTTIISGGWYLVVWNRQMNSANGTA